MKHGRVVPLYDPRSVPQTWNEGMVESEFAVLFANRQPAGIDPALGAVAVIFASLAEAKIYAESEVAKEPYLRCSLYGPQGLALCPAAVIAGAKGVDTSFLSSKFRLWVGSICLGVGVALGAAELASGMELSWAGMIGSRIGPVGAILLLTEAGVRLSARGKKAG